MIYIFFATNIFLLDFRQMLCEVSSPEIGEFGIYNLIHNDTDCNIITASPPVNINHCRLSVLKDTRV